MLQIFVSLFFLFAAARELLFSFHGLDAIKKLEANDSIYFQTGSTSHLNYSQENEDFLQKLMDSEKKAYSILTSVRFEGLENTPVVMGVGAFDEVFNLEKYNKVRTDSTDSTIWIGSKVKSVHVGDVLQYGTVKKEKSIIEGRLPANSTYILREAMMSLDESIVILTSKQKMNELHSYYYMDELMRNSVLFDVNSDEIAEYILRMNQQGTTLSPISFNQQLHEHYGSLYKNAILLTAFYLITSLFVFVSLTINTIQLIEQNLQEYAVHLLYGARLESIFQRIMVYLLGMIIPPISLALSVLFLMGSGLAYVYWGIGFCMIIPLVISLIGLSRLKSSNIIYVARERA